MIHWCIYNSVRCDNLTLTRKDSVLLGGMGQAAFAAIVPLRNESLFLF